jgi:FkbM family methyltransferase
MSEPTTARTSPILVDARRFAAIVAHRLQGPLRRVCRDRTRKLYGVRLELDDRWASPAIRHAIDAGWYEEPERRVLEATLRPDDHYLELGAGTGYITARACQLIGEARVVAYEAIPELAAVATETAHRNGFHPAIFNAVLGIEDGETDLFVASDFWSSTTVATGAGRKIRVPVRSLDRELARTRSTYLMVDIEGGEVDLLGATRLPDHVRAVCVELHPGRVGAAPIQRLLVKLINEGFQLDLEKSVEWVAFLAREEAQLPIADSEQLEEDHHRGAAWAGGLPA